MSNTIHIGQGSSKFYCNLIRAYLKNYEAANEDNINCRGMLLYPTTSEELSLSYNVDGHQVSIKTINLNQYWTDIRNSLINLIKN